MGDTPGAAPAPAGRGRLLAVDAFRGMAIAAMILVNNPGSWSAIWAPLRHAEWHGWTPTDLVFPFFLFIVGVAIVLALDKRRAQGVAPGRIVRQVLRRSAVLFGLGLFLAWFPIISTDPTFSLLRRLGTLRIPGVLQRIALCYAIVSLCYLFCRPRTLRSLCVALLCGYWALMMLVPVPGHGAGQIDGVDTHLAAYLDRLLLDGHLWVQAKTWDPEGLLSTLPAVATTLFGVFTGRVLVSDRPLAERVLELLVHGSVLVVAGYVWGLVFPINKSIWTSSYAVFTAGQAMCALGLCTYFIDVRGHRRWAQPFVVYGKNAITVFVMSGLLGRTLLLIRLGDGDGVPLKTILYHNLFESWLSGANASLAYALCWVLGWYLILAWMHRRNLMLRV